MMTMFTIGFVVLVGASIRGVCHYLVELRDVVAEMPFDDDETSPAS